MKKLGGFGRTEQKIIGEALMMVAGTVATVTFALHIAMELTPIVII